MRKETPALFCGAYKTVDGYLESYNSPDLFVWAAVNAETGEVARDDMREFDDELEDMLAPWEWRRFRLVPETEAPTESKPDNDYSATLESMNRRLEGGGQPGFDILDRLDQGLRAGENAVRHKSTCYLSANFRNYHHLLPPDTQLCPEHLRNGEQIWAWVRELECSPKTFATCSLYLLRELHMQNIDVEYITLGDTVTSVRSVEDLPSIEILDRDLVQSDRYMTFMNATDAKAD